MPQGDQAEDFAQSVTVAGFIAYALAGWAFFEVFEWRLGSELAFGIVLFVGIFAVQACVAFGERAGRWMAARRKGSRKGP
jgi:hypothetical protein